MVHNPQPTPESRAMTAPRLNLIGPGRLGRTLARLWQQNDIVEVQAVCGNTFARTQEALAFIGAGHAANLANLPESELLLLATPDDALPTVVNALAALNRLNPGTIVFHCSGALTCDVLAPLAVQGAVTASIHPLKSFADPKQAITDFAGTRCAYEGNPAALALLLPLFTTLGAHCFPIQAEHKTLYHAGAVLACNSLVALMEAALSCMAAAGVPRHEAWPALCPLVEGTLNNIDKLGTTTALTGPIARGDVGTASRQLAATTALHPDIGVTYRSLSQIALELARPRLSPEQVAALEKALLIKRHP